MNIQSLLSDKGSTVYDLNEEAPLSECVDTLNKRRIGSLIVKDSDGRFAGIVTERDILRAVGALPPDQFRTAIVRQIMTPSNQVVVVDGNDSIETAMELMTARKVRHLPVTDKGKIVGLVSIGDVVKTLLDYAREENELTNRWVWRSASAEL